GSCRKGKEGKRHRQMRGPLLSLAAVRRNMKTLTRAISIGLAFMLNTPVTYSDEGMWLFTDPPREYLKQHFGFEPAAEWLEHIQKSSVRFNSGGSGSFVSPEGLVLSNHHVGADSLQKLSTEERDL